MTTNPFEIGLERLVDLDTPADFIGKAALTRIRDEGDHAEVGRYPDHRRAGNRHPESPTLLHSENWHLYYPRVSVAWPASNVDSFQDHPLTLPVETVCRGRIGCWL